MPPRSDRDARRPRARRNGTSAGRRSARRESITRRRLYPRGRRSNGECGMFERARQVAPEPSFLQRAPDACQKNQALTARRPAGDRAQAFVGAILTGCRATEHCPRWRAGRRRADRVRRREADPAGGSPLPRLLQHRPCRSSPRRSARRWRAPRERARGLLRFTRALVVRGGSDEGWLTFVEWQRVLGHSSTGACHVVTRRLDHHARSRPIDWVSTRCRRSRCRGRSRFAGWWHPRRSDVVLDVGGVVAKQRSLCAARARPRDALVIPRRCDGSSRQSQTRP